MQSPYQILTLSMYKFTTNNQHLAYSHQYQQHHHKLTTSYNFSQSKQRRKNISHYDKHHVRQLLIIHTSSYNHITLFTKDLQGIRP